CGFQLDSSSSEGPQGTEIDAYRRTSKFSSEPRQLTLGEAVATSGAAASPNMGYHSTPAFALLMGVFNIRLGRWVGNPHSTEGNENTWQKTGPKVALFHLLREVFGLTDKASGYVYLSDGGHFENLGIYELVRRRCRYIIACDAGADPRYGFEDLGNAIRKCRTDLGVEIDLDVRQIAATVAPRWRALGRHALRVRERGLSARIDVRSVLLGVAVRELSAARAFPRRRDTRCQPRPGVEGPRHGPAVPRSLRTLVSAVLGRSCELRPAGRGSRRALRAAAYFERARVPEQAV